MTAVFALHGFLGAPQMFDVVAQRLGPRAPLTALPLVGHGAPGPPCADFVAEVERVATAIGDVHDSPPILLGYSLGGRVALGLVARHPQRWRAAVVIGAHPGLDDPAAQAVRCRQDDAWAARFADDLATTVLSWEAQPLFASQTRLPAARLDAQRVWRSTLDGAGVAHALRVLSLGRMPAWTPALARAGVPIVFVAGALDSKFRAIGAALVARVPTVRLVVVPDVGHNVALEAPAAVATLLAEQGA